ncbi:retrovirus-related Pol polyprotein from transposon 412 [Trichonephila clavipes]|nr:retrovirus-related Pol polyprotein from transposon 412 [Trichonephila clavipes]
MDDQLNALLEGINALQNGQEETKNELKQEMQKGLDDTKNELEERMKKGQEETKKGQKVPESTYPVHVTDSTVSVKLSTYDGKTNWEVYKTQFSIISEANGWIEGVKACQLSASLREEAAEILQTLPDTEQRNLNSLYNALDLRFSQKYSKDYARLQMKTRLQKTGESLQEYASEVERVANLAFSDHPVTVREAISLQYFVDGLKDGEIQKAMRTADGEIGRPEVQFPRPFFRGSIQGFTKNTNLDEKQRCAAGGLIKEFQSLFLRTSEDFGRTRLTKHQIDAEEHPSIKQRRRRLPFAKQEEVQKLIKDMKNNDVIEPSSSPWVSPIALVRKKDPSTRFCVDFRRLNDVTKKNSCSLPRKDDTL